MTTTSMASPAIVSRAQWLVAREQPGLSVFLRDGDQILHPYSTYGRGLDPLMGTYQYLDLTPFGRGEGWDGMPDLGGQGMSWLRHHDNY